MKRIAIFTEGQTEQIFVRELIRRYVDASKMRLRCMELLKHKLSDAPFEHKCPDPEIDFLIIDAHGDEGVISAIKERAGKFIEKEGYEKIIGLRDMYCDRYCELSGGLISENVTNTIIEDYESTINDMKYGDRIKLFFAIMETEAWFLGMYNLFQKINKILTVEHIINELELDLKESDPQKEYFKPHVQLASVLGLCGMEYKKKKDEIEAIASNMDTSDFDNARENNRCESLDSLFREVNEIVKGYTYV